MARPTHGRSRGPAPAPPRRGEGKGERNRPAAPAAASPAAVSPPAAVAGPDLVLVGEFGRAQGVRGEVRLKSYTEDPEAIASYGPLRGEDGRAVVLLGVRPLPGPGGLLVARVKGVDDRTAAEALNRLRLYLPKASLPAPGDEDEFYLADLIGLAVVDEAGRVLGKVGALHDFGAGDILEIVPPDGGASAMLAFTKAFVPVVDLKGGRLVVSLDPFAPDEG